MICHFVNTWYTGIINKHTLQQTNWAFLCIFFVNLPVTLRILKSKNLKDMHSIDIAPECIKLNLIKVSLLERIIQEKWQVSIYSCGHLMTFWNFDLFGH